MVDYKEIKIIKDGEECIPFAPNKADKTGIDNLVITKASKLELETAVEELTESIPRKVSELENDIPYISETDAINTYATKSELSSNINNLINTKASKMELETAVDELSESIPTKVSQLQNDKGYLTEHQDISGKVDRTELEKRLTEVNTHNTYNEVPVGAIILSPIDITSENFKKCDGSLFNPKDYPNLSVTKVKFFRLCNLTRSTYDGSGNITFRFFYNDLWTTDPDICKKKNPDLNNLYRQLRYTGKDNPASSSNIGYISNIAYGKSCMFINIQENITMINGIIESESGFYDGTYQVDVTEYKKVEAVEGNGLHYYNNYDYKDIKSISTTQIIPHPEGAGYYIEGAEYKTPQLYGRSTAETDRKISDSSWLTFVTDGKLFEFFDGTDIATKQYVTNKIDGSWFSMEFDFITPLSFSVQTDIFFSYRSLILRIQTDGKLNIYMAGYNSNGVKWRVSNKFTGFTLEPNHKYHLYLNSGCSDGAPYYYHMNVNKYNETENEVSSITCNSTGVFYDSLECNYHPYNYYNSTGIRGIYCADAVAWNKGYFFDLLSLRIKKYDGSVSYTNYGGEFRIAKLSYQAPSNDGLSLPRITGNDGGEYYIRVK